MRIHNHVTRMAKSLTILLCCLATTYGYASTGLGETDLPDSNGSSSLSQQQVITIHGSIKDSEGLPLVGAVVQLKSNMNIIAFANDDGKFTLHVPADTKNVTLVASFVGMHNKEIVYKGQKLVHITLESSENLDDVVVTGYLKLKKNSFTGNATVVKKEEILLANNKNAIAALQAFDPSFRLKEQTVWGSDPNKLPEFTIRGESSLGTNRGLDTELSKRDQRAGLTDNPNLPIFILDGFEVSVQKIYDMDVNRIESMTILKDAAATALYGSRASNGVVVVTTVAPKPGEIRVSYNFSAGAEFPDLSDYNLCNAEEMLRAEKLSGKYTSPDQGLQTELDIKYNDLVNEVRRGVKTDWLAQPLRNVFNQTHSLNFSGGVESIRYSLDLGYITGNGAMKGSYRDRYSAGLTLDYRLKEWLQIMNSISYSVTKSCDSPYGDFYEYAKLKPYWAPFDNDGNLLQTVADRTNPLYKAKYLGSYRGKGTLQDLTNNLSVNVFIADGLSFKSQFSITKNETDSETFEDPKDPMFRNSPSKERGTLSKSGTDSYNWNLNAMMYYNKSVKKHFMNATFGANVMESNSTSESLYFRGFQLSNLNAPAYAASSPTKPSISNVQTRLFGWLGSLNYSYDNIYLLDASIRFDGSSRFGKDKRFAPFWSVGVGMNIHNYSWLKDNKVISMLRWRCTYGVTGNVSFPPYASISTYKTSEDWYYSTPANSLIALGNPRLTWEKTNTWDYGVSVGLFNNRVSIDANYYRKETNDQLSQLNIRTSSGFSTYYTNAGSVLNKGYELRLNVIALRTKDWTVTLNGTMAANKNRITALGQEAEAYNKNIQDFHNGNYKGDELSGSNYNELMYIPLTQYYVGASTTSIYAVPSLGIDPSTGKEVFVKRDGTITNTWDARDEVVCGDTSPKAQGAFSINVGWKGLYANLSFLYQWGSQAYNETLLNKVEQADIDGGNVDRRVLTDRWQKPGDVAPFYNLKSKLKTQPTSRFIQDNNLLALSGLAVGYDFNPNLIKKWRLTSLGIRFNTNEVARWTSIKVERGTSYPFAKNYSFTLSVGF